jgi:dihydrofolate synthase/folylpolyglutamate synthase
MSLSPPPVDAPFFREWAGRSPGERRSLDRARLFADRLGLPVADLHPIVVVGSKGKGTAATYAAAALCSAGDGATSGGPVGLITSPGYRSHHERIRIDGEAISAHDFGRLASRVARALDRLPHRGPNPGLPPGSGAGYLSPTGAFTLAGLCWLRDRGCEQLVVEAGMGGASDESSLTRPSVVAVAEVFEEHVGVIGDDLTEIAANKAGVICSDTAMVVSVPQRAEVASIVAEAAERHRASLAAVPVATGLLPGLWNLPSSLQRNNAELGVVAAHAFLAHKGHPAGARPLSDLRLPPVQLPGRLSVHRFAGQSWVLDSAISAGGVRSALAWCVRHVGSPTGVLIAVPDTKDRAACLAELDGLPVHVLRVESRHLDFSAPPGHEGELPTLDRIDRRALGPRVLALGTISFVGQVLDLLDVDLNRLF